MNWNYPYSGSGGNPEWLDQAKMASLGFDISPAADMQEEHSRNNRQLSKEAYLVLEMDGPAYQQSLQRARQNAAEQDAKLAALPDDKGRQEGAKRAHEGLNAEEQKNSRLFAVDAGLSQAQLRAKYPDRNRHAIMRAQIRPWSSRSKGQLAGYIERLSIDEINVPHAYRAGFEGKTRQTFGDESAGRKFEASVAFGKRLEPWLVEVAAGKK